MKVTVYNMKSKDLKNDNMFPIEKVKILYEPNKLESYREKHLLPTISWSSVKNWLTLVCLVKVKLTLRDQFKMPRNWD